MLIGTNEYSKMEKLEFAERDAREMAKTLLDPDICGFDEVIQLINKGKEEVSQTIEKVFKNAKQNDEVLIYYSGHGKPSYKFDLCLLFKDTDPESLLATSLKFDYINECKEQSACKRLVIILDCCYSGTAGMRGNYLEEMLSSYSGSGTVLLTSTGETGSNIAKEDRELKHGVFTSYLLKGLKDWAADDNDDGIITVDDLYKYTFNETKAKGLQRPQKKGSYEGEMILGRNIPKIKHKELEEKNERLMKYLSTAPPYVLYISLTILQKMYEDPSTLDPMELNIKPHLESLLDSKIEVENYIKIVEYQEKIQKKKVAEQKPEEIQGKEKEKREETGREALDVKKVEEKERKYKEEEKVRREQEEQEKLRKQMEEAERKKIEGAKKVQVPSPPSKKPEDSSGKKLIFLAILLILIVALILILHPDKNPPVLNVSSDRDFFNGSFSFTMAPKELLSLQLQISNEGDGNLDWKASSDEKWITLDPKSGTNAGTLNITVDTENLEPGEYEGKITINSEGGTKQLPVKLVVRDLSELPILALSPDPHSLSFNLSKGKSDSKELQITNEGGGILNWNVSEHETWIKLSQESGTDTGTVTVTVDTDDLSPGKEYDGTITITSNESSEECTVHLNVLPPSDVSDGNPKLKVDPDPSFEFKLIKGESESKEFKISNEGEGTLEWDVSADKEWIILKPEKGTNSETVTVTIDTDDLDEGKHEGIITINSSGGVKKGTITLEVLTASPSKITTTPQEVPVAEFSANVTSGTAPLMVLFTDTGTGGEPASWYWEFGDGIDSKHAQTATHTFTKPGTYTVTLTVTNEAGSDTEKKSEYITVTALDPPEAEFTANVTSGTAPLVVLFTDTSTGGEPTSWYWDFGDGIDSKHETNATHTFTNPGSYFVTLTVTNEAGTSTSRPVEIVVS
nr:PKD domain-containing protein [Methanosarcina siciliae]